MNRYLAPFLLDRDFQIIVTVLIVGVIGGKIMEYYGL